MTPKEFIISKLEKLVKEFSSIRVRYEDFSISNTHFVEVVPNVFYKLNQEYLKWEEETTFEFIEKFPDHNLCFISDDAVVGIDNVCFELYGVQYPQPISISSKLTFDFPIIINSIDKSDKQFLNISVAKKGKVNVINNLIQNISFNNSAKEFSDINKLGATIITNKKVESQNVFRETSFAMAA